MTIAKLNGTDGSQIMQQTKHPTPSTSKKSQSGRAKMDAAAQVDELMAKVRLLEEELDAAKFKAIYYSTVLQVAEQELGLDIEKKCVTKQSDSF